MGALQSKGDSVSTWRRVHQKVLYVNHLAEVQHNLASKMTLDKSACIVSSDFHARSSSICPQGGLGWWRVMVGIYPHFDPRGSPLPCVRSLFAPVIEDRRL
jgi:hypothetical protein